MDKLCVSALIASNNEGHLLGACLATIDFCEERVVIDLESTDRTGEVCAEHHITPVREKKVPMVEALFEKYIPALRNDWVMLIDPDERIDPELKKDIFEFFKNIPDDCGRINVPIRYYYKNRALNGTVWGGEKSGRLLIRRSACDISGNVHTAISLKPGYKTYRIKRNGNNVDHHYWVQSFSQMLEKHRRYTKNEGKARYDKGERYSLLSMCRQTLNAFNTSFFRCKGYKDGLLGLFLSGFYAWYIWASWQSLQQYEKMIQHGQTD